MRGDADIGTPAEEDAGGVGDDTEELAAGAEEAGDALDAGAGVVLVAEEVLEGEEAGDGVEVLRGGEERELEDVAGDEGGGREDVCGAAAELGEGAGVEVLQP